MQYNIKVGFHTGKEPFKLEKDRLKLAQKIVKKENPDILMINEAYFESKNKSKILMDYQEIFGFSYYVHSNHKKSLSPFWGDAILSKYPIVNKENLSYGHKALLKVKIKVKGKIIDLDLIHISPIPEINSHEQKNLVKQILKGKIENYILAGDFNSLSIEDDYNKDKLIKSWRKFTKNTENLVNEMLKRDSIKFILSKDLIDTFKVKNKKFDYTIPTDLLSKDKSSAIRIDYIFCSKDFKILKSGIIKSKLTENASDHYPIYAILEI